MRVIRFTTIGIVFVILMITVGCLRPVRFEGTSMKPTLNNGDKLIINSEFSNLERGDIILFKYPVYNNKLFVKRIIGLPNETVEINNGITYIDGAELKEPYLEEKFNLSKPNYQLRKIAKNEYFVMGDNRDNSYDSRIWGNLSKDLITGRYLYTYWEAEK